MKQFYIILVVLLIFISCRKDVLKVIDKTDNQYIPLEVGSIWIYDVTDIIFYGDVSAKPDTLNFKIRKTVDSKKESSESTTYFLTQEYQDQNDQWKFMSSYRIIIDSISVHRIIEDKREVILNFPFSEAILWNSNIFNTDSESECYYLELHKPKTLNSHFYDSTSTIYREQEDFFISQKFEKETYAKNVGLIYAEVVDLERLEFQNVNRHLGKKTMQSLISYEK